MFCAFDPLRLLMEELEAVIHLVDETQRFVILPLVSRFVGIR